MHVPDGWFQYSRFGSPIEGTKIICVKTPLKQAFNNGKSKGDVQSCDLDYRRGVPLEEEFTPTQLVERLQRDGWNLKAVIDLTFTSRYYNPKELKDMGVQHTKIFCPGREIPSDEVYSNFASSLSSCLSSCESHDIVAVHCTHGLNRTGYLICRYLVENFRYTPGDAIQAFNSARQHAIERENYLEHLRKGCPPLPPSQSQAHPRKNNEKKKGERPIFTPELGPTPIPLFPNHHRSAGGPSPIPYSSNQIHPHHDPPSSGQHHHQQQRQVSSEGTNKASTKHRKRNKKHRKRNPSPYYDHQNSPSRHNSHVRDSLNETSGFLLDRSEGGCMEPEGLDYNHGSWMQAHARGGSVSRPYWRQHSSDRTVGYYEDWAERRVQQDWSVAQGYGEERSQEVRPVANRWDRGYPQPPYSHRWHGDGGHHYGDGANN